MARTVLITGATGALGPHLLTSLLRSDDVGRIFVVMRPHRSLSDRVHDVLEAVSRLSTEECGAGGIRPDRLRFVAGDIEQAGLGLNLHDAEMVVRDVDAVVHGGASTCFGAPLERLREVNVDGTRNVLALAARCRSLHQFLLISTTFVSGTRTGTVPERLESDPPEFVNAYEQTKWEAEQVAAASALPVRIARLSVCLGGQHTGYVHRFGAMHHSLHWLMRGLIPMVPGTPASRVDLIANDVAAAWIARVVAQPVERLDVSHVAAGAYAIPLDELLNTALRYLQIREPRPGRSFDPPPIVDRETFELFQQSVARSGDRLFTSVLESTRAFLPALLYPKVFVTDHAEQRWGGPLPHPDWRSTLEKVIDYGCGAQWRDAARKEELYV
jgi:thioester reductase-like protein